MSTDVKDNPHQCAHQTTTLRCPVLFPLATSQTCKQIESSRRAKSSLEFLRVPTAYPIVHRVSPLVYGCLTTAQPTNGQILKLLKAVEGAH